jgi:methionyl-tRNA synthetase
MEYDILTVVEQVDIETIERAVELFVLLMLWATAWKGIALWKAARANSVPWFIAIFLINTLGILEILYVFVFSKKQQEGNGAQKKAKGEVSDETIQRELELMKEEENSKL